MLTKAVAAIFFVLLWSNGARSRKSTESDLPWIILFSTKLESH